MVGTNEAMPRCAAFKGVVGVDSSCEIYENRPSPCRLFKPSFEDGFKNDACERARAGKGLDALTLANWI
jgi:Fe-S-cluster containining protein